MTISRARFAEPAVVAIVRSATKVPVCVGVPLMAPVPGLRLRPVGRPVAPNEVGPPLPVIW